MDEDGRRRALDEAMRRFGEAGEAGDGAAFEALLSPSHTYTDVFGAFHERAGGRGVRRASTSVGRTPIVGEVSVVTGLKEPSDPSNNRNA